MWLGPIFWLELTLASRRRRLWVARAGYASMLLFAMWLSYPERTTGASPQVVNIGSRFAQGFFLTYGWLQLVAIYFLTPTLLAGAIAEDRERKIFDYLLASPLTNREIIFGKILPRLFDLASVLLAAFPLIGIVQLMGGTSPAHWWYAFGLAFNSLLFVGSLSIWISARQPSVRTCLIQAYLLLIVFFFGPWILAEWVNYVPWFGWLEPVFNWNVASVLNDASIDMRTGVPLDYQRIITTTLVHLPISFLLVGHAVWRLRAISQPLQAKVNQRRSRGWQIFRRSLRNNAMIWKEVFTRSGFDWGWTGKIVGTLILVCILGQYLTAVGFMLYYGRVRGQGLRGEEMVYLTLTVNVVLACLANLVISIQSATSITGEKERDTWLSLMSTPLDHHSILCAKIMGSLYSARYIGIIMLCTWAFAIVVTPPSVIAFVPFVIYTALTSIFFSVFGVFCSAYFATSWRALVASTIAVLLLHGGYLFCCLPVAISMGSGEEEMVVLSVCVPFLLYSASLLSYGMHEPMHLPDLLFVMVTSGFVVYTTATILIYQTTSRSFDKLVGRVTRP